MSPSWRSGSVERHVEPWEAQLRAALNAATGDIAFATTGHISVSEPLALEVNGIAERMWLPLNKAHATALLSAGEPAPYGRGPDTVYDPDVRRATQLDASRLALDPAWTDLLRTVTRDAVRGLGLDDASRAHVEAVPYKLLLYPPGGHFVRHCDTEKQPGMFGTLLLGLPVTGGHRGGVLRVEHAGAVLDWDSAAPPPDPPSPAVQHADQDDLNSDPDPNVRDGDGDRGHAGKGSGRGNEASKPKGRKRPNNSPGKAAKKTKHRKVGEAAASSTAGLVLSYAAFYCDCEHVLGEGGDARRAELVRAAAAAWEAAEEQTEVEGGTGAGAAGDAKAGARGHGQEREEEPTSAVGESETSDASSDEGSEGAEEGDIDGGKRQAGIEAAPESQHESDSEEAAAEEEAAEEEEEAQGRVERRTAPVPRLPRLPLVVVPLEHRYTEANLSFARLKGRDAALVRVLGGPGCPLELHLALVNKTLALAEAVPAALSERAARAIVKRVLCCRGAFGKLSTQDVVTLGRIALCCAPAAAIGAAAALPSHTPRSAGRKASSHGRSSHDRTGTGTDTSNSRSNSAGADVLRQNADAFVESVEGRVDGQALSRASLLDPVVARAAAAGQPAAVQLAAPRVAALEARVAGGPPVVSSWAMPEARVPGYPKVQAFLRGPDKEASFHGIFRSIHDARSFVDELFDSPYQEQGRWWRRNGAATGYSATAEPSRIGRGAQVTVIKTRKHLRRRKRRASRLARS
ncbi:hypothetical protein HYH03_014460 [Edaphochlamys debaryana]|uniref:Fe2OG dioxygenase domain-containing protein n=1 Tax=Edaphochlamys debaryana TaxID=47281 RepID=A0A835XMT7_9CHLO|nr:hypothetical protein HYH03_014460 [Edaphochlamys debaryana]|eukprot:KAG2486963.1 hypothetical protein HYH03_014460 [Edaphochlamys debaryana]